jgi:peptidyl-prolyl cis-trans isomerase C
MSRTIIALLSVAMLISVGACKKSANKNEKQPKTPNTKKVAPAKQKSKTTPTTPKKVTKVEPVKRPRIKGVVAKVNGSPIDSNKFYAEVDKITSRNARIPADRLARIEHNILQRLIEKELIRQAISKNKIVVKPSEVESTFKEYKKRFRTDDQFKNYLKHGRVTVVSIKDRLMNKRALEKLIEAKGNLAVTDDEAKQFYAKNQRFYQEKAGVRASHILIKASQKATPEQLKAAMAKVKIAQKELKKKGADFAAIAKKMSEGPSKTRGGDLGFFGKGQMVKPFQEAAFKMKPGQVSGPIRTRFGFHIIKVTGKRAERKKPLKEVSAQIKKSLRNKKFFQERRKLLQGLKKDAKIENKLPKPPAPKARGLSKIPGHGGAGFHGKRMLGGKRAPIKLRPSARKAPGKPVIRRVSPGKSAVKRVAPIKPGTVKKKIAPKKTAPKKK